MALGVHQRTPSSLSDTRPGPCSRHASSWCPQLHPWPPALRWPTPGPCLPPPIALDPSSRCVRPLPVPHSQVGPQGPSRAQVLGSPERQSARSDFSEPRVLAEGCGREGHPRRPDRQGQSARGQAWAERQERRRRQVGTPRSVGRGRGRGPSRWPRRCWAPAAFPPPALIGRRPETSRRERHSAPGAQANANGPLRE